MKRVGLFIVLALIAQCAGNAQSHGIVQEGLKFQSKILKKEVRYTVYLPFDYTTSNRYYPVVYLLHGYTDDDAAWIQFGEANLILDEAIEKREIPPMILVMPDGGVSWYINNYDGSMRYEDFFFQEFMPFVEAKYRIRTEKRYRGIAGLSMGGYGSLVYSLKHPNVFAACAAFSAAVYTEEEIVQHDSARWQRIESILYGPHLEGKARLTEHLLSYNPLHIIQNTFPEILRTVRWYIDCGDDDFLYRGNAALHVLLRNLNIPHEYRVRDGGHQWSYWRSGLVEGLKFIAVSFHQP